MILKAFYNPPQKYGEVSFFWWHGDKITKEKLHWILEQLKEKGIAGLQLNYCHSDKGGQQYGLTMDSDPRPFSDEWWELLGWLLEECKKYDMSISLSDYTLGAPGQGSYMDAVLDKHPEFIGQKLEWKDGAVHIVKVPFSANPMAKGIGKAVADEFYGAFERHFPGECGKHINYFFSDELNFNIRGNLWSDDFKEEFLKRKGYDITEKWEALFRDTGEETPKIRLDYYDVIVQLSEEEYFRPVYEWHESRGMTFGCDHGGRGQDVTEFGDYFRTMKWNQGPGNDQPHLASNIIKSKVSSSIAHLYQRPRVWLEGFYSSGWQTSGADVADAVFRNFGLGHNLLSLHGLYYSTHGSMWEWAPPCNHYHMPYWSQMGTLLECARRLSYVLSQGVHRCDAAVIYPVAAVEADEEQGKQAVAAAFEMGRTLYRGGIDFDFIDFESVERAETKNGKLCVAGEEYRYLVLPDMANVRFGMLQALAEFAEGGGQVLILGRLPEGSDHAGRKDEELNRLCSILEKEGKRFLQTQEALEYIKRQGNPDFSAENADVFFHHRIIEGRDLYYLYGIKKGTVCRFRTEGIPVFMNPWSGERRRVEFCDYNTEDGFTIMKLPFTEKEPVVLAFEADAEETMRLPVYRDGKADVLDISGEWESEILPTMDNRFGDYRLPAAEEFIGPEAREAAFHMEEEIERESKDKTSWSSEWLTYGEYYWVSYGNTEKEEAFIQMETPSEYFIPGVVSLKYGVRGDAGYQGSYHGLKGKLSDAFITLGEKRLLKAGSDSIYEGTGTCYVFMIFYAKEDMTADMETGEMRPDGVWVNHVRISGDKVRLKAGNNFVLLKYPGSGRTYFVLLKEHAFVQRQPLVTKWYQNTDLVPFDPHPDWAGKTGWYCITAPAGTRGIRLVTVSETKLFAGKEEVLKKDGIYWLASPLERAAKIRFQICQERGYYGCNAVLEPVKFVLGKGKMQLPLHWEKEGLKFYSGGIRLSRTFELHKGRKIRLQIHESGCAVQVSVNGRKTHSLVAEPCECDLTEYITEGENKIELIYYNTMHNHMLTIPTNYNFEHSPDWRAEE